MNRLIVCFLFAAWCGLALAAYIPPPRPVDVAALVRKLGSEDFAEREEATRRLANLSVDAPPPELLTAAKSANPEVRDRAGKALKALRERITYNQLTRGPRFAKQGRFDLYVASTATTDFKTEDPRLWEPALDLGRRLIAKAEMTGDRRPHGCPALCKDFPAYRASRFPRLIRTDGVYARSEKDTLILFGAIQAAGVAEPQSMHALIVSRGPVGAKGVIRQSLVLATGDVTSGDDMSDSVVICDGDVRVGGHMGTCLVIARRKITIGGRADACTLIAGETITIIKPPERAIEGFENIIKEKETNPLGYITFFELSTVGVEAKAAEKVVKVTSITDGKPFANAGVRVGDIILEVNGKKPDSPESLRRLLRDALAIGDATLKLQRGDKTETVKVSLPE